MLQRIYFLLIIILGIWGLESCKQQQNVQAPKPIGVTVLKVVPKTIPAIFEYVAVAQSSHLVEIRSRVEGYLDKIAYTEGGFVPAGTLLFQIDPRPFEAKLQVALSELAKQKAILWDATRAVERYTPLYEKHAASQRDLDNATAQKLAAEANVEAAKANVVYAKLNLSYTTITSPVDGLTDRAFWREGSLISPAGKEGLLTKVSVLDPIWVNFSIPESDLLNSRKNIIEKRIIFPKDMNMDVEAILSDGSLLPGVGKVDFANPSLIQETGSMNVRAVIANPDHLLRPGQFVTAKVSGAIRPDAIIVPQKSVQQGKKGMYVYVVEESKAILRLVETGDWYKDYWIITSGLKAGDLVVTDGVNKVQNNTPVRITKEITLDEEQQPAMPDA